jgi:amino acid transporter
MMTTPSGRPYEFDDAQNATFGKLAGAMFFVAMVLLLLSAIIGSAVVVLARSTLAGSAVLAPVGIALAVMGAQLFAAARRFQRIVETRGNDISNLMTALDETAAAYRVQRWLWLTVSMAIVIALIATIVAR